MENANTSSAHTPTIDELLEALDALLECPDLNLDELEPGSIAAIEKARLVRARLSR